MNRSIDIALTVPIVAALLKKVRKVAKFFRCSPKATRILEQQQALQKMARLKLKLYPTIGQAMPLVLRLLEDMRMPAGEAGAAHSVQGEFKHALHQDLEALESDQ
jgi:hypothetical protein